MTYDNFRIHLGSLDGFSLTFFLICTRSSVMVDSSISKARRVSWVLIKTLWHPLLPYGYRAVKHPVQDWVKLSFVIFDIEHSERQSARMSKITNDGLTRSGTGCFTALPICQQYAVKGLIQTTVHTAFTYPDPRRLGTRPSLIATVIILTWSATIRYAVSTRPLSSLSTVPAYGGQRHSYDRLLTTVH